MDPLTQAVLGGTVVSVFYQRRLGAAGVGLGALAAMTPDLDILYKVDQWSGWLYHRGLTHSLLFVPFAGAAIGAAIHLVRRRFRRSSDKAPPERMLDWVGAMMLALFTHPLLDAVTSYGTQLLAPVTNYRFAWDAVPVIDPIYTILLLIAVLVGIFAHRRATLARNVSVIAFVLSSAYIGAGLGINEWARQHVHAKLQAEGVAFDGVYVFPTIFQIPLRRVIVEEAEQFRVGYVTPFAPDNIQWGLAKKQQSPVIDALMETRGGQIFQWFAHWPIHYQLTDQGDEIAVQAHDLRYGAPGHPENGLWGIEALYDKESQAFISGPDRFRIPVPPSSDNLSRLWQWTIEGVAEKAVIER